MAIGSLFAAQRAFSYYSVRPIVIIDANAIDIDAGYDEITGWELK